MPVDRTADAIRYPPEVTGMPVVTVAKLDNVTVPDESVKVGPLDSVTKDAEESVTVFVTAVDNATVKALEGATVATEDKATTLLVRVT